MIHRFVRIAPFAVAGALLAFPAGAQTVKITPLGGMDGEFCGRDRALLIEDPNGTRILFDPGLTVAGADDPRLGKVDVMLLTHMHWDHIGKSHIKAPNAGSCEAPDASVSSVPRSNFVEIALAKKAKIVTGSEMHIMLAAKLKAYGGDPANSLAARFGGSATVGGVKIATVTANHPNGAEPWFVGADLGKAMEEGGIAGYVGPATGYILKFTNGLVVWLSGDTGINGDQRAAIHDYYHPKLAVMNIGDGFSAGPAEAAYIINDLVQPNSVIPSHANEAATEKGKVRPGTKTETFMKAVKIPVHVPLSGKTMQFDANGKCTAGC